RNMCACVETLIVSRYLNNPSILHAICNAHADATLVRGNLQGSHSFLVFYSFRNVSFFILSIDLVCCVPLLSFCLLLWFI
ncbi:MAG: hypothetical protein WB402_00780, partial [Sulfuricaulis sp.]|uniref:hypothetical protein n=1 Tax=Sulfuricaulis sp. TaxID=2003553 RepID=UPI003C49AAEE